jgi:hypothetical protein
MRKATAPPMTTQSGFFQRTRPDVAEDDAERAEGENSDPRAVMTARRALIGARGCRHGSGAIAGRRRLISRGVGHMGRRESMPAQPAALDLGGRRE